MRSGDVTCWVVSAVMLGASGVALAQGQVAQGRSEEGQPAREQPAGAIEEVAIVTKRLEESLPQQLEASGSRVSSVTATDIKSGGFNDLGQTLQYSVPGLYLAPTSGQFGYADVSLQGSRPEDLLWLVDGVRVNNRLYASTLPLDTIPAHMIERIEVLEGGQSLFYGSQAIAGVVNVITREFASRPGGEVAVGLDDNEGKHFSGYLRGALGGNNLVLWGSLDEGDGYQPFRDRDYQASATDRSRGYDVKSGGFKFLRDFSDAVRFSASYQHTDANLELLTAMLVAHNVNSRDEDMLSAKLDLQLSERVDVYVKGYYHDWDTSYTTLYNSLDVPGTTEVIYDNAFWGFHDYGASALMRLKPGKGLEYFLGYDIQKYGGRDDVLLIADNNEQTQAVLAQVRTSDDFSTRLHLSAGVRYNSPSDANSETVWTGTAKYDISPDLFVRTVIGTAFRLPTAEELYAIDPFEIGNPNLMPETSKNLNLSVGGALPFGEQRFTWELIGFFRDVTHLISFQYDAVQDVDVAQNVPGTVKVRGGELALSGPLSAVLSGRLSFTRSSSEDAEGLQIQRIPRSMIQAGLDFHPASGRYGASLAVNRIGDVFATVGPDNVPYGDYTLLDVSGRYFLDAAKHHRLGLRLENAFDEEYGRPSRARRDVDNSGYVVVNRGTPRTLHLNYTYAF